jgi:hypothetical protein
MIDTYQDHLKFPTAPQLAQRTQLIQRVFLLGLAGLTGVFSLYLVFFGVNPALIAWLIYLAGAALIFYRPHYGLYLVLFFTLAGDALLVYWYPFTKNLSSAESLMYLHDSAIISPLEIYLLLIFVSWLGRGLAEHKINFYKSQLFWPALAFTFFIMFGLLYGIGRGGSLNIGLWEARPIFYISAMLILTNNLIIRRQQVSHLVWTIVLAIFVEGLIGTYIYFFGINRNLTLVESLTEHSAAIHINAILILWMTAWLYKGGSTTKRLLIPLMLPAILLTYLAAQRRAAFLTIIIALVLMVFILFLERRIIFWLIVPPATLLGVAYLAAFWNSSGALGLPAQAIKSIVAEDQATAKDQSSNLYRQLENVNAHYTISQAPLTGVGFGQKLQFIVPLPDISFFLWWEYITHNSIIWIWIKTGVGGFASMILLIGLSIIVGMRALQRMPTGDLKTIALTSTLFLIMHFIYAYVDISWDNQSMVLVGAMMGLSSCLEHVVALDIPIQRKRYPWQKDPQPESGLRPRPVGITG